MGMLLKPWGLDLSRKLINWVVVHCFPYFHFHLCVCVYMCGHAQACAVTSEARRWHWIPWSKSYMLLLANQYDCWELNLDLLEEQ